MATSADEASINVALASFSDARIIKKMRAIEQIRSEIRADLGPARELATKAPLNHSQLEEFGRLVKPVYTKCETLDSEIAALNRLLEEYVGGLS